MILGGEIKGANLYAVLSLLAGTKFNGTLELQASGHTVVAFLCNGSLSYLESDDVAQSFPAFLLSSGQMQRDDLMAAMNLASQENSSLLEALKSVSKMSQRNIAVRVREHGMKLLASMYAEPFIEYITLASPPPRTAMPSLPVSPLFSYLSFRNRVAEEPGELRSAFPIFDDEISPTQNVERLKTALLALFPDGPGNALIKALLKGPTTLTHIVGEGHDAYPTYRAFRALYETHLVRLPVNEKSVAKWRDAFSFLTPLMNEEHGENRKTRDGVTRSTTHTAPAPAPEAASSGVRPTLRPSTTSAGGDAAVEEALHQTLSRIAESPHYYESIGMAPDNTSASLSERLEHLILKYSNDNYSGFMMSTEGISKLNKIQELLQEIQGTLLSRDSREVYHASLTLNDQEMKVPISAIFEAEIVERTALERMELDAYSEAIPLMEQAIGLVPHCPHLKTKLAWLVHEGIQKEMLDPEEFIPLVDSQIQAAMALESRSAVPYQKNGRIMQSRGRANEALAAYQKALSLNARDPHSRNAVRTLRSQIAATEAENTENDDDGNMIGKLSGMFRKRST